MDVVSGSEWDDLSYHRWSDTTPARKRKNDWMKRLDVEKSRLVDNVRNSIGNVFRPSKNTELAFSGYSMKGNRLKIGGGDRWAKNVL